MLFLILSILFSTLLFVIFKYFELYKVNVLQAIIVNYIVAFVMGMFSVKAYGKLFSIASQPWFYYALFLGLLFVTIFFAMAKTAQKNGVSVASIASKMSVVIPVTFGVILYNESVSFLKVVGIIIALIAVYLSSVKDDKINTKASLFFPLVLFLGSGAIDTALKYVEANFVAKNEVAFFSGSLFGFAACFGIVILLSRQFVHKEKFQFKSIIAGVVLGIPNYYSIVFLIKALQNKNVESSTLFTINNVGIVVMSTIVGLLLFKESFSAKNKIGIALAILGIILVYVA
ncbi:EamA family transporter [Tenacibaculum sp. UWU-22]|uniref:EamA family transporter n=1 Tax=Tenacibaculum sp. UWU-22 TaxID=3234187 RepID=UPI0034DAFC13